MFIRLICVAAAFWPSSTWKLMFFWLSQTSFMPSPQAVDVACGWIWIQTIL